MPREIRVIGIKRKQIDEDKLALAFLMLARSIQQQKQAYNIENREEPEAA